MPIFSLETLSSNQIDQLICCPKIITKHARREMITDYQSERNDLHLISTENTFDEKQKFSMFIRRSIPFQEDFSIGLIWLPPSCQKIILYRCNGCHGKNRSIAHQRIPHIHKLSERDISMGNYNPHTASITNKYNDFTGAILFFLHFCNIIDGEQDFPDLLEQDLFRDF